MRTLDNQALFRLATSGVQGLKPYEPGKPTEELEREFGINNAVKLASNENPLGCSENVKIAIKENIQSLNLYPDGNAFFLKERFDPGRFRHD